MGKKKNRKEKRDNFEEIDLLFPFLGWVAVTNWNIKVTKISKNHIIPLVLGINRFIFFSVNS